MILRPKFNLHKNSDLQMQNTYVRKFQKLSMYFLSVKLPFISKPSYLKHDSSIYYHDSLLFFFSRKVIFSTHQFCQIGVICNFLLLDQYSYNVKHYWQILFIILFGVTKRQRQKRIFRRVSRGHTTERDTRGRKVGA